MIILRWFQKNELILYYITLVLLVLSFSSSRVVLRTCEFTLFGIWVVSGNYQQKYSNLKKNRMLLFLSSFFFMYVIALLYSPSITEGLKETIRLLPWFALPLIIASYPALSKNRLYQLLAFFIGGVLIHTLFSYLAYVGNMPWGSIDNFRDMGFFYSHHRFALFITTAIFFLLYLLHQNWQKWSLFSKTSGSISALWLIYFLFFSKFLTGIFIFTLLILIISFNFLLDQKKGIRLSGILIILTILLLAGIKSYQLYASFWATSHPEKSDLPAKTENGNPYTHLTDNREIENGNYTWLYLCKKELKKEWNEKSELSYDSETHNDFSLKYVLIRYLTSKGLPKDSTGISHLNHTDIQAIEDGIANYRFKKFDFTDRLYNMAWELYHAQLKEQPMGTLTGRLFAYQYGINFWLQQPFFGHGSQTMVKKFENYFEKNQLEGYYVFPHNQFLKYLLEFGIFGFIWFLLAVLYPYIYYKGFHSFLINILMTIIMLACLANNTLSSQLAMSFFVFFYSLFIVSSHSHTGKRASLHS